jgi:hypothetical protein
MRDTIAMTMTGVESTSEDDDDVTCCIDGVEGCNLKARLDDQSRRCCRQMVVKTKFWQRNVDFMTIYSVGRDRLQRLTKDLGAQSMK